MFALTLNPLEKSPKMELIGFCTELFNCLYACEREIVKPQDFMRVTTCGFIL